MTSQVARTPRYVLLKGQQRAGPKLAPRDDDAEAVAIYAFSDKSPYDRFCANCNIAYTPYPLVKGYLKNQLSGTRDIDRVVVIDAAGPNEAQLNAVSMASLLESLETNAIEIPISWHLMREPGTDCYRMVNASAGSRPPRREPTEC